MLILAIVFFLAAVVCGLMLLIAILQGRPTNKTARKLHGVFAGIALIIMIVYALTSVSLTDWPLLLVSLILLVLAAFGGLAIFMFDRKKKHVPIALTVIHPIIAVAGLILLIVYILP